MVSGVADRPIIENLYQPAGSDVFVDDICRHPNETVVGQRCRDHEVAVIENEPPLYVRVQSSATPLGR